MEEALGGGAGGSKAAGEFLHEHLHHLVEPAHPKQPSTSETLPSWSKLHKRLPEICTSSFSGPEDQTHFTDKQ